METSEEVRNAVDQMTDDEVIDKLNEFSRTFKPSDCRPFLDMEGNATLPEYRRSWLYLVWKYLILHESGYDEGVAEKLHMKYLPL